MDDPIGTSRLPAPARNGSSVARALASPLLAGALLLAVAGCSPQTPEDSPEVEREATTDELERLALVRFGLYRTGTVEFDCDVLSEDPALRLQGWVDTTEHHAYGLVTGNGVAPFLASWTTETVDLQAAIGTVPPLPAPADGWERMTLEAGTSVLAAAQLMIVGLASDRPENPTLLGQNGARWLRAAEVGGVAVDVFSGPVPEGASSSSFRYWVDEEGALLRVEARLDGSRWSGCGLTPATDIEFDDSE